MRHFHEELEQLKEKLLSMGSVVERMIEKSVDAILIRDPALAKQVFRDEGSVNQLEIEIDKAGHSLLALEQPMAFDLRLVTSILKINTDLERLGDHAVNIAERALLLCDEPPLETNVHFPEMASLARGMLKDALRSFMNGDMNLAQNVLERDDQVDAYNDDLYRQIQDLMEKDPLVIKTGMKLVRVGHDLERIADLAGNIAEDTVYMKSGKEVRHRVDLDS